MERIPLGIIGPSVELCSRVGVIREILCFWQNTVVICAQNALKSARLPVTPLWPDRRLDFIAIAEGQGDKYFSLLTPTVVLIFQIMGNFGHFYELLTKKWKTTPLVLLKPEEMGQCTTYRN